MFSFNLAAALSTRNLNPPSVSFVLRSFLRQKKFFRLFTGTAGFLFLFFCWMNPLLHFNYSIFSSAVTQDTLENQIILPTVSCDILLRSFRMAQEHVLPMGEMGLSRESLASGKIATISSFQFNRVKDSIDVDFCELNLTLKSNGKLLYPLFTSVSLISSFLYSYTFHLISIRTLLQINQSSLMFAAPLKLVTLRQ